jgi:ribonuclease P protein component
MLPKKNKIQSLFFKTFSRKGQVVHTPLFSLRFIKHKYDDFRAAVIVSKKVSRKAVERNLLKRRFFSIISQNKELFQKDTSYIFTVKKEGSMADMKQIKDTITSLLS